MTYEAVQRMTQEFLDLLSTMATHPDVPVSSDEVQLASPGDVGEDDNVRISIYPYHVRKDGSVGSMSTREVGESGRRDPPLPVAVDYLVSAYPRDDEKNDSGTMGQQHALGLVLQTVHDRGVLEADEMDWLGQDMRLTLSIREISHEELMSLWARFDAAHQPSVVVTASPVMVASLNESEYAKIQEREVDIERASE